MYLLKWRKRIRDTKYVEVEEAFKLFSMTHVFDVRSPIHVQYRIYFYY
jgi:hypothetical protein